MVMWVRLMALMFLAGCCDLVTLPLHVDVDDEMGREDGSRLAQESLGRLLRWELKFGAHGVVSSNQTFGTALQCCFYKEGSDTFHSAGESGYLYELEGDSKEIKGDPPLGMRSSVPLGGLGTGSTELRADGTFTDWLVENGGPGLSLNGKIPVKDEMLLAIKVGNLTASVRTHPPAGLPGVESLVYSGAFPVSRLSVSDAKLKGADATIYGYSPMKVYDEEASGVPCIVFSMAVSNASPEQPLDTKFGLILPLSHEKDQARGLITFGEITGGTGGKGKGSRSRGSSSSSSPMVHIDERFDHTDKPSGRRSMMACNVAVLHGRYAGWIALAQMEGDRGKKLGIVSWKRDGEAEGANPSDQPPPPGTKVTAGCGGKGRLDLTGSSLECMQACRAQAWCVSWTWEDGVCFSIRSVGVERRRVGAWSGIIGDWSESDASLGLSRPGTSHASGDFTVRGYADGGEEAHGAAGGGTDTGQRHGSGDEVETSMMTGGRLDDMWQWFSGEGVSSRRGQVDPGAGYGGYAVSLSVPPGEERVLSLVFAWRLPHRMHAGEDIGNGYASKFETSRQVAEYAFEMRNGILEGVAEWHR